MSSVNHAMGSCSTLQQILSWSVSEIAPFSSTPRLDAELLLAHVLGVSRVTLLASLREPCLPEHATKFQALVTRRCHHEPVAYLTGIREFWGLQFNVSQAVLIPRPDTETIVARAIEIIEARMLLLEQQFRVLDLGTGSGCIAIALAHEARVRGWDLEVVAIDQSQEAVMIASSNAQRLGVADLISFRRGSWFEPVQGESFSLIVGNPPYLDRAMSDLGPELQFEPSAALFSDQQGLADILVIVGEAGNFLSLNDSVLIEIGHCHSTQLRKLYSEDPRWEGWELSFQQDLAGIERVAELIKKN